MRFAVSCGTRCDDNLFSVRGVLAHTGPTGHHPMLARPDLVAAAITAAVKR